MPEPTILGVNFWIVAMIVTFFCVVVMLLLGPGALENGAIAMTIALLSMGLTLLIANFGWAILIIPSILILAGAGYLLKQLM